MVEALEPIIDDVTSRFEAPTEFVLPGEDRVSAALDLARAIVRRAERAAERGQQDIEDAIANLPPDVSDADFAALDRVYRDAYNGVYSLRADNPDPDAGGPQPVRRSRADAA